MRSGLSIGRADAHVRSMKGRRRPFSLLVLLALPCFAADDLIISDFKHGFGDWPQTGTAFKRGTATGDLLEKLEISNSPDRAVASSEIEGDGPTGTLTSPEFNISRKYISYLIGGGDYERVTCLNLRIGDKIVHSASGRNSDRLMAASWDVGNLQGQAARLQIVDEASGDWGHVNVDDIVQTDTPSQMPVSAGPLYGEALRPQFHFTARQWTMNRLNPGPKQEGWINDLNGLIFYDGEYHLFAQRWWKCWLHAVSRDLVHWTELEPAFFEASLDNGTQSGTCVVDYNNTSGLSPDKARPPMVAFWSRKDGGQHCISYSLDHGRTWKFYTGNPILIKPERDPKVFWHAATSRWVMVMYGNGQYHILTSKNLLQWTDEKNPISNSFECPDLFQLPVDGNPRQTKWVLIQGNGQYSIGDFSGTKFTEESPRRPADVGPNFYATQSWHNNETGDGRRIQAAWMRGSDFKDMPFNQQISFPCELTLHNTSAGIRLFREPIREVETLHQKVDQHQDRVLKPGESWVVESSGDLFHIKATVQIPAGAKLTFNLRGVPVTLTSKTLESAGTTSPVLDEVVSVELLLDRGSLEVFVNHGEISSTRYAKPSAEGISLAAEGGEVVIRSIAVFKLASAWPAAVRD